jgi:hypothetical protein
MAKRDQTPRQASGEKSGSETKGLTSRPAAEPGRARPDDSSSAPEGEEGHCNKLTPIEQIFLEEVGREMEPEERQILLGIPGKRRKSRAGPRNRPSLRKR